MKEFWNLMFALSVFVFAVGMTIWRSDIEQRVKSAEQVNAQNVAALTEAKHELEQAQKRAAALEAESARLEEMVKRCVEATK